MRMLSIRYRLRHLNSACSRQLTRTMCPIISITGVRAQRKVPNIINRHSIYSTALEWSWLTIIILSDNLRNCLTRLVDLQLLWNILIIMILPLIFLPLEFWISFAWITALVAHLLDRCEVTSRVSPGTVIASEYPYEDIQCYSAATWISRAG